MTLTNSLAFLTSNYLVFNLINFRNAALKECDSEVKRLKRELDKIEEVASDLEAVENDDNLFAGEE